MQFYDLFDNYLILSYNWKEYKYCENRILFLATKYVNDVLLSKL